MVVVIVVVVCMTKSTVTVSVLLSSSYALTETETVDPETVSTTAVRYKLPEVSTPKKFEYVPLSTRYENIPINEIF